MRFESLYLYTISGQVRAKADPTNPNRRHPGSWDARTVVLTAKSYHDAHEAAADALIMNWSSTPHEAEVFAVRPTTADDLKGFKYVSDPAFRVYVEALS